MPVPSAPLLCALPADADGPSVWKALGADALIASVYRGGDPAGGVAPAGFGALLAAVDTQVGIGATMAVCVQVASCLPLLAVGARPGPDPLEPVAALLADALLGARMVALAATDEVAGSDLADLRTEVRIDDDGLCISGEKRWITNATTADAALVLARHRPGRQITNFTWVLVPMTAPGVEAVPADCDLFPGSGVGHLSFTDVRLPRSYLVGRPGRGLAMFAAAIAVERLGSALWGVALCRRVLVETRCALESRRYGDGSLWQLDSVRQRYATCVVLVRQLHALAGELGEAVTAGRDTAAGALLKSAAATTVERVLDECAHLRGAEGFARGGVQRLRSQATLFGIGGGVTEVVLGAVADVSGALLESVRPAAWPPATEPRTTAMTEARH